MIELSRAILMSEPFKQSMSKVATCQALDPKVAYRVMRTVKILEGRLHECRKDWIALVKKYVPIDEKNNFVVDKEKNEFAWLDGVDSAVAKKEIEEFGEVKVSIDRDRFELDHFAPAKLAPTDLASLEPLLNSPE